jgi:hypothetical protein
MEKYEHTMPGYREARQFLMHRGFRDDYLNRLESHELVYVANKLHSTAGAFQPMQPIPYSTEGCHEARQFLLKSGYSEDYLNRLDGEELLCMALFPSSVHFHDATL